MKEKSEFIKQYINELEIKILGFQSSQGKNVDDLYEIIRIVVGVFKSDYPEIDDSLRSNDYYIISNAKILQGFLKKILIENQIQNLGLGKHKQKKK